MLAVGGLLVWTWAGFRPASVNTPRFTGALASAPELVAAARREMGDLNGIRDRVDVLAERMALLRDGFADEAAENEVRVLHISDIHLNPVGLELARSLADAFEVAAVIDTGDLTSFGVDAEARVTDAEFRMRDSQGQRDRYEVEIHKKFSLAAACLVFVLIGAPIALRFPRGGVGLVIGVSFVVFGLYYVGLIGGETLANEGYLPPWLAMWIANIILFIIGLALAARMGRETATSRGGDFGELLFATRTRAVGWLRRFGIHVERRQK